VYPSLRSDPKGLSYIDFKTLKLSPIFIYKITPFVFEDYRKIIIKQPAKWIRYRDKNVLIILTPKCLFYEKKCIPFYDDFGIVCISPR